MEGVPICLVMLSGAALSAKQHAYKEGGPAITHDAARRMLQSALSRSTERHGQQSDEEFGQVTFVAVCT